MYILKIGLFKNIPIVYHYFLICDLFFIVMDFFFNRIFFESVNTELRIQNAHGVIRK